jgi:hypothetical protein
MVGYDFSLKMDGIRIEGPTPIKDLDVESNHHENPGTSKIISITSQSHKITSEEALIADGDETVSEPFSEDEDDVCMLDENKDDAQVANRLQSDSLVKDDTIIEEKEPRQSIEIDKRLVQENEVRIIIIEN